MTFADVLGVVLFAAAVVAASEGVTWWFVYKLEDYHKMIRQVAHFTKVVEDKKALPQATTKGSKASKQLSQAESQLRNMSAGLTSYSMRVAMINLATVLIAYQILGTTYAGVVVAKLPFTPFGLFTNITHRGLEGEDYTDASAHMIFALALMSLRTNAQKYLEHVGVKPRQPKQPGIWEMANAEAEKMSQ